MRARAAAWVALLALFAAPSVMAEDKGYNALPSYAQDGVDTSKVPTGFPQFWQKFQSAVIRGDMADIAGLTIFPFNVACDRSVLQLEQFALDFDKQMQTTVMINDPRIDQYVEMNLYNLIVFSPVNHPEFHYSHNQISLNRLTFYHTLSKWYFACW